MPLSISTRLGLYEVVSAIGAGGMGEVYRARDTKLNRDVALKVLPDLFASDPDRLSRFKREAQVLASLNHPNIAQIHGFEEDPVTGAAALVLEYVDGQTLEEMTDASPLPVDDTLPIAIQIAEALEAAHEKGIVHRDLKPANVKVTPDGTVKVLNFGLAKALQDEPSPEEAASSPTMTEAATRAGIILGTAAYMSPEQARGRPVDRRIDNWAFGCVLYELLAGTQAYSGDTVSDIVASVLTKQPDWSALPPLSAGVTKLLRRCLEKDAKRRLQHIGDARLELEDARTAELEGGAHVVDTCTIALGECDILAVSANSGTPRPLLATDDNEALPAVSPNGRWMAYASDVTGQSEIWARPYAEDGAPVRISTDDGTDPLWSAELADPDRLEFSSPERLFESPGIHPEEHSYDVLPDGRFVMLEPRDVTTEQPFTVIVNWIDTLGQPVP
ncbi:MAG: protein kinase [Vicinamibacterales bacterium]|jgi:serine/threonine-protein kinase|nr:hypothetical protein [Acidobacteriota bacterium]MDP7471955.1 protein kinase [Vicinamibacterales bacterium]MDP7670979.1 protein kinase [Vicinamibacterales bacterium]HJO38776.1 protein kinase [Vicinamibacterales bacterium]|tara:strand:- start:1045 stop:2379 length:1335 start_codon:yes stop_codon:yes gene_type:complete